MAGVKNRVVRSWVTGQPKALKAAFCLQKQSVSLFVFPKTPSCTPRWHVCVRMYV